MSELNLDNAFCNLMLTALNKYRYYKQARIYLKIERTRFYTLMDKYGIKKVNGQYVSKNIKHEKKSTATTR